MASKLSNDNRYLLLATVEGNALLTTLNLAKWDAVQQYAKRYPLGHNCSTNFVFSLEQVVNAVRLITTCLNDLLTS